MIQTFPGKVVRYVRRRLAPAPSQEIVFTGDYASWSDAARHSGSYDDAVILARTRDALLQVKRGMARWERDSVLLEGPDYSFPLLTALLRASALAHGQLRVADFGGSLGSTYFQCRSFLADAGTSVRWCVVEQPAHVACGREYFESDELRFHERLEPCLDECRPNMLLLSSVLQYLPDPYAVLGDLLRHGLRHVVVDRTAFLEADRDRLTVQHVPAWIYPASYPAWFLSETKVRAAFAAAGYVLVADFAGADSVAPEDEPAYFKGFIYDRC
jgi:putative methyltransferase (TIGR04325 family)